MNEDRQSFNFKPMTLYSFFPKSKRLKLAKKDSNISLKNKKQNINIYENSLKEKHVKNNKWSNKNKYDYYYNFTPNTNTKQNKFNYLASSTSNNFYNNNNTNNNNYIARKHSVNYKKDKTYENYNFNGINNIDNREINEKYMEQFLDNYDSKLKRNKKNMKNNYTNNNNNINNNLYIKSNKNNNIIRSTSKNKNNNNIASIKYKSIIRLNSNKLYNYLPYLNFSSKKSKKNSPKTLKQILLNENYNINTINSDIKNYYNNVQTLYKNLEGNNKLFNLNNFNSTQKNNFFQVNINPMINSFNTNNNMISE